MILGAALYRSSEPSSRRLRTGLVTVLTVTVAMATLVGCSQTRDTLPGELPSSAPPASVVPTMAVQGGADANAPIFDKVVGDLLAANPHAKGREIIDTLVAHGFVKTDMEVTADATPLGHDVLSIEFSVKFSDTCLIGQNHFDGALTSIVQPVTAAGTCLVGESRKIDW